MLQSLHVKNLALIDEAEVEFQPGLNILSGETGAGKSIIIGSVNLALGEKVPKEMVRENAPYGLVELVFTLEDEKQKNALKDLDIFPEEDTVILSRKIVNGRSTAKINGETLPVSKIREAAALLIDIHGQHEHQSLLMKKNHLNILDAYAKNELQEKKEELKKYYNDYKKYKTELDDANLDKEERAREISFLEYEIREIEEGDLKTGEDMELEQEFKRLSNGRKIMEAVGTAYRKTGEDFESASEQVGQALKEISAVSSFDKNVENLEKELMEIESLLNDFNHEIAEYIADAQFDEESFARVESRLDTLNHLKSKYGATVEEILENLQEKQERLKKLGDYDSYLENLKKNYNAASKKLENCCEAVSKIRKKQGKVLTDAVRLALMDLNFLDVSFSMEFKKMERYTQNGYDEAEFMISTNPGEPLKPLEKIASGGELSRIMLAIKTVLADTDSIETLIFDEIDTGISGRTAQMVSEKMSVLGRNHQVICITHLPQIAAMADSHYLIEKSVNNQTTISTIRQLSQEESVKELARMIGGVKITETVLDSAREMKELAANTKKSLCEEK